MVAQPGPRTVGKRFPIPTVAVVESAGPFVHSKGERFGRSLIFVCETDQ